MELTATTTTTADPARAWAALIDVTDWPRWSASMTEVTRLDDGPLRTGSRARVKQPGMAALAWEVTDLTEGSAFAWAARTAGVRIVGGHRITADPDGTTRLTLTLSMTGALAGVLGALTRGRNRRYLDLEVTGWKNASES